MEWLNRFIQVMDIICDAPMEGAGITELMKETGLSKATLHRMAQDMVKHQLLVQISATRKYRLGPKAMVWGSRFVLGQDPSGLLAGYCDQLAERTNLYVFLCRFDADQVYCIYTRQPPKGQKKYFVHVGQRMPLHCTAAAKAIIAFLPTQQVEVLLNLEEAMCFTTATKTFLSEIIGEFPQIQRDHLAYCREELEIGVSAISTPVFPRAGQALFSISLIGESLYIRQNEVVLAQEILDIGRKSSHHMRMAYMLSSAKE